MRELIKIHKRFLVTLGIGSAICLLFCLVAVLPKIGKITSLKSDMQQLQQQLKTILSSGACPTETDLNNLKLEVHSLQKAYEQLKTRIELKPTEYLSGEATEGDPNLMALNLLQQCEKRVRERVKGTDVALPRTLSPPEEELTKESLSSFLKRLAICEYALNAAIQAGVSQVIGVGHGKELESLLARELDKIAPESPRIKRELVKIELVGSFKSLAEFLYTISRQDTFLSILTCEMSKERPEDEKLLAKVIVGGLEVLESVPRKGSSGELPQPKEERLWIPR